jgi:prepilin-type N-terminal cleavage/methylation domain-containing protein
MTMHHKISPLLLARSKALNNSRGFTLIELLIVIGIITVLAAVVIVSLNPGQRFKDARDARRTTDVQTIISAIHLYLVDNKGSYPAGLSAGMAETQLGTGPSGCAIATGGCAVVAAACVDTTTPLAKYLKSVPMDPNGGTAATTKYSVVIDANGIVTVKACGTEGTNNISISR